MSDYAEGWFMVCWSAQLAVGQVVPRRYFSRAFVLFRAESGEPVLLDAHCPHLGAHLGYGGRVEGSEIICPFHAWRFDGTGRCTAIPYASRIPKQAALGTHTVVEHSGMILVWFSPADRRPDYTVPPIAELDDPAWTPLQCSEITVSTCPREVIENVADKAHFLPVHGQQIDDFEMIIDGPRATQRTLGRGMNLRGKPIPVRTVATYHGPAVQITRLGWAYDMVLINSHVPIDAETLVLRFGVSLKAGVGVTMDPRILDAHVAAARDGYFQDVAIWEHKRWRDRPVLVAEDGPIGRLRQWYRSFFVGAA